MTRLFRGTLNGGIDIRHNWSDVRNSQPENITIPLQRFPPVGHNNCHSIDAGNCHTFDHQEMIPPFGKFDSYGRARPRFSLSRTTVGAVAATNNYLTPPLSIRFGKLKVSDLMSKEVIIVKRDTKVTEATKIMKDKRSSCIVVADGEGPIGIVTENDFVIRVLSAEKDPQTTPVDAIMSTPLVQVSSETSILDAIAMMHEKDFSQLPVMENSRMVGLVRFRDLMQYLAGFFSAHRW